MGAMKVKHLCPWCSEILISTGPDLKEADNDSEYAEIGKSIIGDRLLHVILNCKEVENS